MLEIDLEGFSNDLAVFFHFCTHALGQLFHLQLYHLDQEVLIAN